MTAETTMARCHECLNLEVGKTTVQNPPTRAKPNIALHTFGVQVGVSTSQGTYCGPIALHTFGVQVGVSTSQGTYCGPKMFGSLIRGPQHGIHNLRKLPGIVIRERLSPAQSVRPVVKLKRISCDRVSRPCRAPHTVSEVMTAVPSMLTSCRRSLCCVGGRLEASCPSAVSL